MKVEISSHTLERAEERGATEEEIEDVIKTGEEISAKHDRIGKEKVYNFDDEWNGKHHSEKLVRVFYILFETIARTVTVIVRFGKFTKDENHENNV